MYFVLHNFIILIQFFLPVLALSAHLVQLFYSDIPALTTSLIRTMIVL
jgi:hypothetical protein